MEPVRFSPPVSQQRYDFVISFVDNYKPKKVADLGCNECSLLHRLRFWNCIELLVGVDIDEDTLRRKQHTLTPLPAHYLKPLERPLTVILYKGSVCEKDPALLGFDLISCIELIEHLEADDLDKLDDVLFGFMAPKAAVISTPNAEFNILLPKTQKFRHPDHKFEWSREEFQSWALKVARHYNYTVEFSGVGKPPPDHEEVGFCSQIAVFMKNYTESEESISIKKQYKSIYNTVLHVVYPSLREEKYLRKAILNEALLHADMMKNSLVYHHKRREEIDQDVMTENNRDACQHSRWPFSLETAAQSEENQVLQPFIQGNTIHVPLEAIFSISGVKKLCGSLDVLRSIIAEEVPLSGDGKTMMYPVDLDDLQEV
ncbi:PREDICTED: small RNA 2'-O-methyltransferase [Nanorana parkeri]|uniref:small RNA 2'-O-methyltransferase n=1 Tax=Nanorana parkeri TaxID=125878 RepID=UPI0008547E9D|nr:PREDICTED: small RNA 2'-O-methyltransferase [Nanorana parkeri]